MHQASTINLYLRQGRAVQDPVVVCDLPGVKRELGPIGVGLEGRDFILQQFPKSMEVDPKKGLTLKILTSKCLCTLLASCCSKSLLGDLRALRQPHCKRDHCKEGALLVGTWMILTSYLHCQEADGMAKDNPDCPGNQDPSCFDLYGSKSSIACMSRSLEG